MKKKTLTLTGALALLVSSAALADGWVGLNYAVPEQDDRFFGGDRYDTGDIYFRLGANINKVFSSELRAGATVSPHEKNGLTFQNNYIVGGFLRASYQTSFVTPYVTVGYIWGEETLELRGGPNATETFDDIALGVGVDIALGERLGVNAEFTRYYDIGDVMLRGPSAGLYWRF